MPQVKIYGLKSFLSSKREILFQAIHNKKFHRYILLEKEDFIYLNDRSEQYIIIELSIFEGRTVETKKQLIY